METLVDTGQYVFLGTTVLDGAHEVPTASAFASTLRAYEAQISMHCAYAGWRLPNAVRVARMVHGNAIATVRAKGSSLQFCDATDGLVTTEPGVALVITGGDCPPVFIASQGPPCIGLAHSGRAGTLKNISGALVDAMREQVPHAPLRAWIGPGICGKCYRVNAEILKSFSEYPEAQTESCPEHLDLPAVIKSQLRSKLKYGDIWRVGGCTFEREEQWFSYRRDVMAGMELQRPRVQAFIAMRLK